MPCKSQVQSLDKERGRSSNNFYYDTVSTNGNNHFFTEFRIVAILSAATEVGELLHNYIGMVKVSATIEFQERLHPDRDVISTCFRKRKKPIPLSQKYFTFPKTISQVTYQNF